MLMKKYKIEFTQEQKDAMLGIFAMWTCRGVKDAEMLLSLNDLVSDAEVVKDAV